MDPFSGTAFGELVPHSCEYCRKIDINYGIPTTKQFFRYEDVCKAISHGCDLNYQLSLEIYFEWTDDFQRMNFQWLDDNGTPFYDDNDDWLPLFALEGILPCVLPDCCDAHL
jgi:hypothetical protein